MINKKKSYDIMNYLLFLHIKNGHSFDSGGIFKLISIDVYPFFFFL